MSADLFVHWKTDKRPTHEEAEKVIHDFFGPAATESEWKEDRFFVTLVGKWSMPLIRVVNASMRHRFEAMAPEAPDDGRYLEVWLSKDSLDIITRRQDDFTHACQKGLAHVFARFWDGVVEE